MALYYCGYGNLFRCISMIKISPWMHNWPKINFFANNLWALFSLCAQVDKICQFLLFSSFIFDTYEFFLLKFIYKNKISNYPSFPSPKFQHKKGLMNSYWFGNHVLIRYFIFFFAIISMIHFLYILFLFWYIWIFWNQIWVH